MSAIVASFYSYKGGVGRTMTIANAAIVLARWGYRTLCMDWDLEAPGLHRYFGNWMRPSNKPGIVELITAFEKDERPNWRHYVETINIPQVACDISFIRAGILNENYLFRMQQRNLATLYERSGFDRFLEQLLEEWKRSYDIILVDVRCGITDVGGICTVLLPDILVSLYTSNRQTLDGAAAIANRAIQMRYGLPIDRGALLVVPVFARAELSEAEKCKEWLTIATEKLHPFYGDWASRVTSVEDLIAATRIPYIANWSFGENVPVVDEQIQCQTDYGRAIAALSALLVHRCVNTDVLVSDFTTYISSASDAGAKLHSTDPFSYDVFISFPSVRRDFARLLADGLKSGGFSVFLDEEEIITGDKFAARLEQGIGRARHMVALCGEALGPWQQAEISHFFSIRSQKGGRILPVLMRGVEINGVPWFLHQFHVIKEEDHVDQPSLVKKIALALAAHSDTESSRAT